MERLLILTTLCVLVAVPAAGQKVFVDYDKATPFSEIRTFQFKETAEDLKDTSPSLHRTVMSELRRYLAAGHLEEAEEDPDVYVTYHAAEKDSIRFTDVSLGYTYGPNWFWSPYWTGYGTHTRTATTFREGTLVIDVWDRKERRLIWRGMATAAVSEDPQKMAKKVDKALKRIMKQWDETYGDYARKLRALKIERES